MKAPLGNGPVWASYCATFLHENPLCDRCKSMGTMSLATEVVHIRPVSIEQDETLFWNRSNHEGLCGSCYSRKMKKEEDS